MRLTWFWRQRFLLAALVVGCAESPAPTAPMDEPEDVEVGCPSPGGGVSIGGETGTGVDAVVTPTRKLILMGGGREDDEASRQFVEAARGGDVVILRRTGSLTSYPDYFTTTLVPNPAARSVVTIRTSVPLAGADASVDCWVSRAEAVWLAGGNQWDYLGGWPEVLHENLSRLAHRGAVVGGTSAGAMVLGEAAFDARHGGVISSEALASPLSDDVSVSYPSFFQPELEGVLVDTHFMARSREGRLLVFLARFLSDQELGVVVGIGLDEGVALVIQEGLFRISTDTDRAVWFYEVRAPVALRSGVPLSLSRVRRLRMSGGSSGPWPIDFGSGQVETLVVVDGVILR